MADKHPMPGPGQFQWNTGGWFGGQIGSTAWMLVGAALLAPQAPAIAAVWLLCFAVPNVVGTWMWWRRDRIRPYPALQLLLLSCLAGGLAALITLDAIRPEGVRLEIVWDAGHFRLVKMPWEAIRRGYLVFLFVPALMVMWHFMERRMVRERLHSPGRT
jgi:hypothetical protein